jgi:Xaa-Pro aminopeptidase
MVVSLEPGLYRSGQWGIRLENLVLIKTQDQNEFAAWLGFEVLTLVPFEPRLIEPTLLNSSEVDWLEAYNTRVKETLWPHLSLDAQEWLQRQTQRWKEILKDDRFS